MANEFVVRNGIIVSGSAYLESISQSLQTSVLGYNATTNEVFYQSTASLVPSTASFAVTASFALNVPATASTAVSASFAQSASNARSAVTASSADTFYVRGSVGIGTTSPSQVLEVVGNIKLGDGGQRNIIGALNNSLGIYASPNANTEGIIFSTDNGTTTEMFIQDGGNVGIGTTNPQAKLDVSGSISLGGTAGRLYYPRRLVLNAAGDFAINNNADSQNLLYVDPTKVWVSGSLGVGTSSPGARLDIAYSTNPTTATPHIVLTTGGTSKQAAITAESFAVGGLVFSTGDGTLVDRMTILRTDGNVGIGTTNPSHKLAVVGAVSASSFTGSFSGTATNAVSASFAATASSADAFYVRGTQTVGSNFQIDNNGDFYQRTTGGAAIWSAVGNTTYPSYAFYNDLGLGMYRAAEDTLAFTTSGSERMRITSDGNIAINSTSTSGYRLYVNGSTWINGGTNFVDGVTILRTESGGSEVMRIASSGNVGIGTTNPTQKLVVSGNTTVTGVIYTDAVATYSGTSIDFRDQAAASIMYLDASNKRVGIGITNPSQRLVVSGSAIIGDGTLDNPQSWGRMLQVRNSGSNGAGLSVKDSNNEYNLATYNSLFHISDGVDERLTITAAGDIGIGITDTGGWKLRIDDTTGDNLYLYNSAGGGNRIFFADQTWQGEIGHSGGNLLFKTGGTTERMRITNDGNVGIGTNNPSYKLHVSGGNGYIDGDLTVTGAITAQELYVEYISSSIIYSTGSNKFGDATSDIHQFTGSVNISGSVNLATGTVIYGDTTNPSLTLDQTTGTYLKYSTTSELALQGSAAFLKANDVVQLRTGTTNHVHVSSSGNVGIGTTNPGAPLAIVGAGGSTKGTNGYLVHIGGTDSNVDPVRYMIGFSHANITTPGNVRSAIGGIVTQGGAGNLVFETGTGGGGQEERMRITGLGDVGIGLTNPSTKFQVVGAISASGAGYIQGNLSVGTTYNAFAANIAGTAYVIGASVWVNDGYGYVNASSGNTGFFPSSSSDIRINSAGTTRLFIASGSGNVGIGTTSPDTKLHVFTTSNSDQELLRLTVAPADSSGAKPKAILGFYTPAETNTANYTSGRITSKFDVAGYANSRVTIESLNSGGSFIETLTAKNGNVGIGTTNPAFPLQLNSTAGSGGMMSLVNTSTTEASISYRVSNGGATTGWVVGNFADDYFMYSYTFAGQAMTLKPSGNVGFGTTSPNSTLQISRGGVTFQVTDTNKTANNTLSIYGLSQTDWAIATGNSGSFSGGEKIVISDGGNIGIGVTNTSYKLGVTTSSTLGFRLQTANSTVGGPAMDIYDTGRAQETVISSTDGTTVGTYVAAYSNHPLLFGTNAGSSPAAKMILTTGGSVGIGSASPAAKLDIVGASTGLALSFGTTVPNNPLFINTYGGWSGIGMDSGTAGVRIVGEYTGNSPVVDMGYYTSATVQHANWTSVMMVRQGGNVGIGTTSPNEKLHVAGNIHAYAAGGIDAGLFASTSAGSTTIALRSNGVTHFNGGNVGIGTTAPATKLQVVGSVALNTATDGTSRYYTYPDANHTWYYDSDIVGSSADVMTYYENFLIRHQDTSNVFLINGAGNVGVGTTGPQSLLQVGSISTATYVGPTDWNQVARFTSTNRKTSIVIQASGTDSSTNQGLPAIEFDPYAVDASGRVKTAIVAVDNYYGYRKTDLAFVLDSADDLNPWAVSDAKLYIKNDGNVGIGTTSPSSVFEVYSNANANTVTFTSDGANEQFRIRRYSNTNEQLIIGVHSSDFSYIQAVEQAVAYRPLNLNPYGGNVGIATTTPSQKLAVYGDIAIANSASIQETRIGKYQSGSLGSGTHTIASISVTNVDAVFFDYVIKNSTTDLRAGTVMAVTNGSTVEYTDISTSDIGDTSRITMISDVSGGNIRLRASIDTGAGSWTIRTLLRTL